MTGLQEYDLEINPVYTIKGYGYFQLVEEAVNTKEEEEYILGWEQDIEMYKVEQASPTTSTNCWYIDVCQYFEHDIVPSHFST